MIDAIVEHATGIRDQAVVRRGDPAALAEALGGPAPAEPTDPVATLERLLGEILPWRARVDHPRFFAFVPGPGNVIGAYADALASGLNLFAGTWLGGSGVAAVELVVLDWLRRWCGLPEGTEGLLTSGGSMANLTALAVARQARLGESAAGAVVYASDQTHSAVGRALRVLGFGPGQLVELPADDSFRLDPALLAERIAADRAAGSRPFCVVANAGTTNTGAVDPLAALADLCEREDVWLHVDAAYGGGALLCPAGRAALAGIERAHSLALDPHKWLFQPFEIGCALVRDGVRLAEAFHARPEYLRDVHRGAEEVNFGDRGVQLTRAGRALKLWWSVQAFGLDAFRAAVEHGIERAVEAERILAGRPCWEIAHPASLGIVAFRWADSDRAAGDRVTAALPEAALADGYAYLSSTVLDGRTALRLCTINPRTTDEDLRGTIDRLEALAEGL